MSTWTIVLLAGLASFALRLVPVVLLSRRALPAWLDRVGPLTAPVAFAALGTSAVVGAASGGAGELLPLLVGCGRGGAGRAAHPIDDLVRGRRDGHGLGDCRARRSRRLGRLPRRRRRQLGGDE